jgi:DNA-binding SARP family transcriptional activator/class 3 adenylate cyclase/tetratricopeptide (TPR) repeat protein
MARLSLTLLGPFGAALDREPVTGFDSNKVRALLAYLAVELARPHPRSYLAGLLWPDWPERSALANLRGALANLRTAIGDREASPPFLRISRETIQLNPKGDHWVDAVAFSRLAQANAATSDGLEQAIALYRGPFMEGFSIGDGVAYEDWISLTRDRMQRQVLATFQRLVEHREGQGDYGRACEVAWRWVELAPWQEQAHRATMHLLALSGQRGAALAQYEACRRALREELDVEPGEETRQLYERIRDGELGPRPVPVQGPMESKGPVKDMASGLSPLHFQETLASRETITVSGESTLRPKPAQPVSAHRRLPQGQRRVVTALVADVQGHDGRDEEIDAEDWVVIVDRAFQILGAAIHRYGGEIQRYRSDGLVATFGLTAAHEDDPERAVLAALAMQDAARRYVAELGEHKQIQLLLRIGINTGQVIAATVGESHHREEMAVGHAVAAAARIATAAEPGAVLATEETYRLLPQLFEWQASGEVAVEGSSRPLALYRPLAPRAAAGKGRGIAGLESPLVGRDAEARALKEAIDRLRAGVGGIVTVIGEAGIGKSRLVAEVCMQELGIAGRREETRAMAQGPTPPSGLGWVEGRCVSYASGVAYQLWLDTLYGLLGVRSDAPPSAVRQAMQAWVRAMCPQRYDEVYPYLAHLASLPLEEEWVGTLRGLGAQGIKAFSFRAVEALIESAARQRPQVIVCEDLHWADPTSLELLERLLSLTDRAPLLLICVFRPQMGHDCWRIIETTARDYPHRHTDLRLAPLSPAESETLVGNMLGAGALPAEFSERILEHAEGNPFYVEEILRSLMASGTIVYEDDTGCWRAERDLADIPIPDTLRGVLAARIDRLDARTRYVLQRAAVIGRTFAYRVLSAIVADVPLSEEKEPASETLDAHLIALQRAQLIRERARLPEVEYTFKHHLTQEAAYDGLLKQERRLCHRQVAEVLEHTSDRVEEQLGLLAYHWEQAGEAEQAAGYLRRAGEQAAGRFANAEAAGYFSRALELTAEDRLAERCALLLAREEAYRLQGMRKTQGQDLVELERVAAALDDPRPQARVALRQAHYAMRLTDYRAALAHAEAAVQLAETAHDVDSQLMGYRLQVWILHLQGKNEAAKPLGERALALARKAGTRLMEGTLLRNLGSIARMQGDYAQAKTYGEMALQTIRVAGDRWHEASALNVLTLTSMQVGHFAEAKVCAERALRIFREIGDPWGEGSVLGVLGQVQANQGSYVEAKRCCEQALIVSRATGDRYFICEALSGLGTTACWQGCYDEARDHLKEEIRSARETGEGWDILAISHLGLVAHLMGNDQTAREYGGQALHLAEEIPYPHYKGCALTVLGHALLGLNRPVQAAEAYQRALALRRELGQHHLAPEPLAGLARVALAQDDLSQAQAHVDEILPYLDAHPALHGTDEPFRIYMTCYRVLQAGGDPRAERILDAAYHLLQERASQFEDEAERRAFLENVAAHRELAREWQSAQADKDSAG